MTSPPRFPAAHRGHPRSYRLSRVLAATVLDEPSSRPADLEAIEGSLHLLEQAVAETLSLAVADGDAARDTGALQEDPAGLRDGMGHETLLG